MPDHLTKNARTDSRQRKLLRGLRLYLFGPTVFVAMMLAFDSIPLSAITGAICLSINHADLERRSPYLAGLEQSLFAYWRQFAVANVPAMAYTVVGVFAGHSVISVIREAIGFDPSLAGVFGIATPADAPAAAQLADHLSLRSVHLPLSPVSPQERRKHPLAAASRPPFDSPLLTPPRRTRTSNRDDRDLRAVWYRTRIVRPRPASEFLRWRSHRLPNLDRCQDYS
jgi:hypothetical protein